MYPKTEPLAASSSKQKIKTTFYEHDPRSQHPSDKKPTKKEADQQKEWEQIRRQFQELQQDNSRKSTPKKQEFNIKMDQASLQALRSLLKK